MATLRNKRTLGAVSREMQEITRNSHSQNTSVPGITEKYITQVFEEIKGRVTKKLSQEFSTTESRISGALPKLDEFLLNPLTRTLSGSVPGTSQNIDLENREPTGDISQSDPRPKAELSTRHTSNSVDSDPEETSHKRCCCFLFLLMCWNAFFLLWGWTNCEDRFQSPCLPQNYWVVLSGEENTPFRDKDRLRSDPHEFPGFLI